MLPKPPSDVNTSKQQDALLFSGLAAMDLSYRPSRTGPVSVPQLDLQPDPQSDPTNGADFGAGARGEANRTTALNK